MKHELYIRRNIPECMSAAWTLMSTNVARVAKALWLPALIMALVVMLSAIANYDLQTHVITESVGIADVAVVIVSALAVIAAAIYLNARIIKLLNLQKVRFCVGRSAKATLVAVLVSLLMVVIFFAIAAACTMTAAKGILPATVSLVIFILLAIIAVALMLIFCSPVTYTLTKYLIEPETNLKTAMKSYRAGLKDIGFIVGMLLLCAVVVGIANCIVALPGVIAMLAAAFSNQGIAIGDAPGLPSYFMTLYSATTFFATFVMVVMQVWYVFALYYMYASIEAKGGRTDSLEEEKDGGLETDGHVTEEGSTL